MPDVATLVDLLLEQPPKTGSPHDLDRVAGTVFRKKGADFVYDLIASNFLVETVDPRLEALYSLPWKRIYTTNYDNATEVARSGKRPVSSVTLDDPQRDAVTGSIVHLNGYVKRIEPSKINEHLLLTDASYAASRLVETGWLSFFEHDLRNSRAIIFAGYSLYDLDVEKVLLATEGIARKAFFFIAPDADEIEVDTLGRYGKVVPGGIDALVAAITKTSIGYQAPEFATGLTSVREITVATEPAHGGTAASKIEDQLVYGVLPEREVLTGELAFDRQTYVVERSQDREAKEAIRLGPWRDVLLTGELSSGKSASTLVLSKYLRDEGYRIYYAEKGNSLISDLRRIATINDKVAVVFDGYSGHRAAIADYASRRPQGHRIIMTERSGIHEFIKEFVDKTPHLGPVFEATLDRIAPEDVPAFEALTNFGGFWEDRAGASVAARQSYIGNKLDGSLSRLLLEIIKSKKVQEKICDLLKPITNDSTASQLFCSALIVNALKADFTISEWQYLFSRNNVRAMMTNYSDQAQHFFSMDSSRIYVRNGLLSSHVLHGFMDDDLVKECLLKLYELAERYSSTGSKWFSLKIELMRFGSIEPMFSGPMKKSQIFDYYDNIRAFGSTVDNPDYWLQLGIASTALEDLGRGKICFKNAYAREKAKTSPNLTRIDNYAARFDMKCAAEEENSVTAFDLFINANEKLGRQIFLDSNRHYPFKVGRVFSEVAAKHYEKWNEGQQSRFRRAAFDIRRKARDWKTAKKQHNTDVDILIKETSELLARIGEP